jgi:hypothetical protein
MIAFVSLSLSQSMWQKRTGTLHLLHSKTWFLAKLNYIREACKSLPGTNILAVGESVEKRFL